MYLQRSLKRTFLRGTNLKTFHRKSLSQKFEEKKFQNLNEISETGFIVESQKNLFLLKLM